MSTVIAVVASVFLTLGVLDFVEYRFEMLPREHLGGMTNKAWCESNGAVLVGTYRGAACIKRDAYVELPRRP